LRRKCDYFFPFSERSGLNAVSEFNLDNLSTYKVKDESASLLDTSAVSDQDVSGEPR
jgi:THO complex subunit 1